MAGTSERTWILLRRLREISCAPPPSPRVPIRFAARQRKGGGYRRFPHEKEQEARRGQACHMIHSTTDNY
ncbi:hypothetical protein NL676_031119 [Syzygium grande]|nr:hypothetical protein NL676_031119 [Syzygium grande]